MKLIPHPSIALQSPIAVAADVDRSGSALLFRYSLSARADAILVPRPEPPGRSDKLWQTTCFEAFLRGEADSYAELNFSPSGRWAAYRFTSYREGMAHLPLKAEPRIELMREQGQLSLSVLVPMPEGFSQPGTLLSLTAVVEEKGGQKSYWALAHGKDERPDFHDADCFVARLP